MSNTNHSFFEVTANEIAQLSDTDLCGLVVKLCETEFQEAGLAPTYVRSGGHQDAPDGGVDIEITIPPGQRLHSNFLQHSHIVIQVKKSAMPPAKIKKEMRLEESLRPVIESLAAESGAYIIVSSESVSSSRLRQRTDAMREAMVECDSEHHLHFEFIDASALATWVQKYPGIVLWVKVKTGNLQQGWSPFESWARVPEGGEDKYILGEKARLFDSRRPEEEGLSLLDGVNRLRQKLSEPRSVTRLVGLSGVGKTRLVQALFEDAIGATPLASALAVYTDVAAGQQPTPTALIEQFVRQGVRAVVILDNCGMELHNQAEQICHKNNSQVSMISIEYDVREDIAFETGVFRLEPSSEELIEELVHQHYPHISHVDARTIAEFSGGNARIADALADTIEIGETVSGMLDEDLFRRLFVQKNSENDDLLRQAEALSLVYSYNVENTDAESELAILGEITGENPKNLYSASVKLERRGLVQARSKWRAVLPHAIANRLAKSALQQMPGQDFHKMLTDSGPDRLVKSFSRRLGYLHDCPGAVDIVEAWLKPDGWLGKGITNLSSLECAALENIAPVSPESVLAAIEHASKNDNNGEFISRKNANSKMLIGLLRSIAYEKQYFDRCMDLLFLFALSENQDEQIDLVRSSISSMFSPYFSGTWASVDQRVAQIKKLLWSGDENLRSLGADCLRSALQTRHFSSFDTFNFGARPRDFGYQPRSKEDVVKWYNAFVNLAAETAVAGDVQTSLGRKALASNFRGLWLFASIRSQLMSVMQSARENKFWPAGWRAVRESLYFDKKKNESGEQEVDLERLFALEKNLRPVELYDRAVTYVFAKRTYGLDAVDPKDIDSDDTLGSRRKYEQLVASIGNEVAKDKNVLSALSPEVFVSRGAGMWSFGEGLAVGANNLAEIWSILREAASQIEADQRDIRALKGFMSKANERDPQFVSRLLDELLNDFVLGTHFPDFQTVVKADESGYRRLLESLDSGVVPTWRYQYIAWGRAHEAWDDDQISEIIMRILDRSDGFETAAEIISMRFFEVPVSEAKSFKPSILRIAQKVLELAPIQTRNTSREIAGHELSNIARHALRFEGGEFVARNLCARFEKECRSNYLYMPDYQELFLEIAATHPNALLDIFAGNSPQGRIFGHWDDESQHPILSIPNAIILSWGDQKPETRYAAIAGSVRLYQNDSDENPYKWHSLFWEMYERVTGKRTFLDAVCKNIIPTSWSGNRSFLISSRECLFTALESHSDAELRKWAKEQLQLLKEKSAIARQSELEEKAQEHESFE